MDVNNLAPVSGRVVRENNTLVNTGDYVAPVPNGATLPITVSAAGVTALPTMPAGTTQLVIVNPNADVVIAFNTTATANLGMHFGPRTNPVLTSAEQIATASVHWLAADAGACCQPLM